MCAGDAVGYPNGWESPISGLPAISCPATISRPVTVSGCGTIRDRPDTIITADNCSGAAIVAGAEADDTP